MKVKNMTGRSGREVPNQFIIKDDDGNTLFQSYSTIIVKEWRNGNIELDENAWNYSKTTGKYRNMFLGETKAETEKKINAGIYKLVNLN